MDPLKIGVSACLLGENVRYNGGHQLNHFIRDILGQYMQFVPVCPEVECGLPIPRETMRLVGDPDNPRLLTSRSGIDHTEQMQSWIEDKLQELAQEKLCGFIFKKDSPSSGLYRVKVYSDKGMPQRSGSGFFARAFTRFFPLLPVEEDGRLNDPRLRENFIESVFVYKHFQDLLSAPRSRGALVDFHTRHKLLFLARSQDLYRRMGRFIANLPESLEAAYDDYGQLMAETLRVRTTMKKHCNVLHHVLGYFKKQLSADEKQEILELIEAYHRGDVPLIVPITLLNHYVRKYEQPYLQGQYYLHPHPLDLRLRSQS
ncbi:YbgA family protein [Desulfobulbus alkaliphilus]|uniref:YbgA family protein n=1 Tax=Desulfobulbus alkaliphilus TaxID=869814 RepID=UPI0019642983|nr:DUF523 and DUF1722 domain-containing protein [Desulfobulbus alkaliphilus]MBM9537787.1 DUF523 and DUF1722 domain-containing protein [Desulfobulbus alkaliphilus]